MIRAILALVGVRSCLHRKRCSADEASIPKPEHPRPDAMRPWANLNGRWEFRFDAHESRGSAKAGKSPARRVTTARSWCRFPGRASFRASTRSRMRPRSAGIAAGSRVPEEFPAEQRVWLRFGAVDWRADVWVNGRKVAEHEGGYTPFEADISDALDRDGENVLVVRAFDPTDPDLPTGKQVGWYTPSSGIWQTVWLEARPKTYIAGFRITTQIQPATVRVHGRRRRLRRGEVSARSRAERHRASSKRRRSFRAATSTAGNQARDRPTASRPSRIHGRRTQALDPRNPQPLRRDARAQGCRAAR